MKVVVPRETRTAEHRVALVPEHVSRLITAGCRVAVEPDAGRAAGFPDDSYRLAGATVDADALTGGDVFLGVQPPDVSQVRRLAAQAATISFFPAAQEPELVRVLRDTGRTSFAMELVPRISRAQAMDALSSQAMVAGYRAALIAAEKSHRFFPLLMTAAGTAAPARVLVLGAGVAGLQAIATARRLGAVVSAYDVREASAEEVRSLGAKFVDLDLPPLEGAGGYAREMSEQRAESQRKLLTPHVADSDVLITTASVPGRPAPLLVTRDMVGAMRPGSVVVDLAAEQGGNVEGVRAGETVEIGEVRVFGARNVPSQMPAAASRLYSTNIVNLVLLMVHQGGFAPDFEDEVVAGCCVTHAGEIRHQPTRQLINDRGFDDPAGSGPQEE